MLWNSNVVCVRDFTHHWTCPCTLWLGVCVHMSMVCVMPSMCALFCPPWLLTQRVLCVFSGPQCLDASRPWLCYWILHSLELLEEPVPASVASEWVQRLALPSATPPMPFPMPASPTSTQTTRFCPLPSDGSVIVGWRCRQTVCVCVCLFLPLPLHIFIVEVLGIQEGVKCQIILSGNIYAISISPICICWRTSPWRWTFLAHT